MNEKTRSLIEVVADILEYWKVAPVIDGLCDDTDLMPELERAYAIEVAKGFSDECR